nr:asparagine synthetase [glutamine-hydrolyzing] 3 [uncultured bacterium]
MPPYTGEAVSGIAAILQFDGSPIDTALLDRMTAAVAHRGPDRSGTWTNKSVALGHRMFCTTEEAVHERQPLCDENGQVCLVFDGRVDNREELRRALLSAGMVLRDDTDAELVLNSYLQWGENAPVRILGDFAFAIWDGPRNALFCARDAFGVQPLNYYIGANFVLVASELHQLFCDSRVPKVPNEGMVGEYLALQITHQEETLWEGIRRLPAAHFMWVKSGLVDKRRYWDFDLSREVRHQRDDEYAREFLSLLQKSITCRLRCHGRIGSHLSGGLDSSSVSVIANELLQQNGSNEPLDTFSLVFCGTACDESEYINDIVKHANLRSKLITPSSTRLDYYCQQALRYRDFPGWPNGGAMNLSLRNCIRSTGTRVMLTGWGGNECLEGSPTSRITHLARKGKLAELLGVAESWSPIAGTPSWQLVLDYGVRANIPASLKRASRVLRRNPFPWLSPEFVRRTSLLDRIQQVRLPYANAVQQTIHSFFYSGWSAHFHETRDRDSSSFGIDERHPFFDRRLAEFAFALPEEQRADAGLAKVVLRKALRGNLPSSVLYRRVQTDFTPVLTAAVATLGEENRLFEALRSEGWVVEKELLLSFQEVHNGNLAALRRVWAAAALNFWYSMAVASRPED